MDDVNETLARILERTGDYRVARRVPVPAIRSMDIDALRRGGLALGIAIDTETTGLGPEDEVIELGMAKFAFDPANFRIVGVTGTFSALREPGRPIPPEVTRLTGLSMPDVAGHAIDAAEVGGFVEGANVILAHNASFDRPVCERAWPVFAGLPWACSLRQIDWQATGSEGHRLAHLLGARGLFHGGHRALDDCLALVHLLRLSPAPASTFFAAMMEAALAPGIRLWAVGAPYDRKDMLKSRGYRWSDGTGGAPRAWHREIPEADAADELAFLREHVYGDPRAAPLQARVTAYERFSARAESPRR